MADESKIKDRELSYVRKLAQGDNTWDEVFEQLLKLGFEKDEAMEYILETISLDWSGDDPLDIFGLWELHKIFGSDLIGTLKKYNFELDVSFSDIYHKDGKDYLVVSWWCDFKDLFKYSEDSYAIENVFCKEDFFEWFDFNPTFSESWDNLNKKSINYIKTYLKEKFLNKEITLEEPDELEDYLDEVPDGYEGDRVITLTTEKIDSMSDDELEILIDTGDELENLKYEINWSLSSAFNNAAYREIHNSLIEAIEDLFGKPIRTTKTVMKNGKKVSVDELVFDITSFYEEFVNDFIESQGENPSDEYSYGISFIQRVLDDRGELLSSGINFDYFHPDVTDEDMYEEIRDRF